MSTKAEFLQVRVSRSEKRALARAAATAGLSVSAFVLARALPPDGTAFARACDRLKSAAEPQAVFATLHDLLATLDAAAFEALPSPALERATFEEIAHGCVVMRA